MTSWKCYEKYLAGWKLVNILLSIPDLKHVADERTVSSYAKRYWERMFKKRIILLTWDQVMEKRAEAQKTLQK